MVAALQLLPIAWSWNWRKNVKGMPNAQDENFLFFLPIKHIRHILPIVQLVKAYNGVLGCCASPVKKVDNILANHVKDATGSRSDPYNCVRDGLRNSCHNIIPL